VLDRHLLDEFADVVETFDVYDPRRGASDGMCLQFFGEMFEPRRQELEDAILRVAQLGGITLGLNFWMPRHPSVRAPEDALPFLVTNGVGGDGDWAFRALSSEEEASSECEFCSQRFQGAPKHSCERTSDRTAASRIGRRDRSRFLQRFRRRIVRGFCNPAS
jgi:hypothetical protein